MMNITMPERSSMGPAARIKGRALPCRVLVLPRRMPTMMFARAMGITEISGFPVAVQRFHGIRFHIDARVIEPAQVHPGGSISGFTGLPEAGDGLIDILTDADPFFIELSQPEQGSRITGGGEKPHSGEGNLRTGIRRLLLQRGLLFLAAVTAGIGKVPGAAVTAGPGNGQLMALITDVRRGFRTAIQADP